ncbi:glycosyltransferase [Polaromonas sp.]|uniref:glycosyltransferase family 4 protein n=1 Tax=Polaromonas sp. TaxID=1869339 RepID=UPI0013B961E1|nr:glycosyltransferase [Polaromonas sp.]NDP61891.1 glycosyltransferase [Polaromonas sp.]
MKVLHIIVCLNVGGAELMLKRLIESHKHDLEYSHSVISLTSIGKVGTQLQELGIDVQALNMRSALEIPRVLWQLVRSIRASAPDVVQTWMYHADLLGGIAARLAGNRNVIWGIHSVNLQVSSARATRAVRLVCAWLSGRVPHTIVCVAEASRNIHLKIGYDAIRMIVVPNGVDYSALVTTPDQRAIFRSECGFLPNELVIGTVGRFNPAKDYENFVRAAGLLAHQNSNLRFLIIGRQLDESNIELGRWITQTGYSDRFLLLGERSDVSVCLAAMDIFCLSSRTEAFPTVVCEAMAIGLPCVVTDAGDTAMLVADTGVVVPKEDSVALAQGLKRLLDMSADGRSALGKKSIERIQKEFSMNRLRERYEAIYTNVVTKVFY